MKLRKNNILKYSAFVTKKEWEDRNEKSKDN